MIDKICDDETVVGHELISEKNGLFRKKLSLKPVTYGYVIREALCGIYKIDTETIYEDMEIELKKEINRNFLESFSLRNGGEILGRMKTEKRMNYLKFKFKDSYLKKSLELFSETH